MRRKIMKHISILLLIVTACTAHALPYNNSIAGDLNTDFSAFTKPFIGTNEQLKSNKNALYIAANTTNYGAGTWVKIASSSFGYNNNGITIIIDAAGQVWQRIYDGKTLQSQWAIPEGLPDTTDVTPYVQSLVNEARDKKIVFDNSRQYRFGTIYSPAFSYHIDFNYSKIYPPINAASGFAMISLYPVWNSLTTGLYNGNKNQATSSNKRKIGKIVIEHAIVDLEHGITAFAIASLSGAHNTTIEEFNVSNNTIKNYSNKAIAFLTDPLVTDSTGYGLKYVADSNTIKNGGPFGGLALVKDANIGDTAIYIKTVDGEPIIDRLESGTGRYFNIGTHLNAGTTPAIDKGGYATTHKVFRLKSFVISDTNNSYARLHFTAGGYSNTNGWADSAKGLTAPVIKNAMIIPVSQHSFPLLFAMPNYSGSAGSRSLAMHTHNETMDAAQKNMFPGLQFMLPGIKGKFTICNVHYDSIIIDKPLPVSITNKLLILIGKPGDAIGLLGYVKQSLMRNNTIEYNGHAFALSGATKQKIFNAGMDNTVLIEKNTAAYHWMTCEINKGVSTAFRGLTPGAFDNVKLVKADNWITINNPANYRVTTKNLGFGTVKVLTNANIADADITPGNSIAVTDIGLFQSGHYRYKVIDFDTSGNIKKIKFARYNYNSGDTVAGGFEATYTAGKFSRSYSDYFGEGGTFANIIFNDNTFKWTTRNAGGGGYHISGYARKFTINGGSYTSSEETPFEFEGDSVTLTGVKIFNYTFTGAVPMPSLSATNGGYGRGAQGFAIIYNKNVDINSCEFNAYQPSSGKWGSYSGTFLLAPAGGGAATQRKFSFRNNIIRGVRTYLFNVQNKINVNGINYPSFYWEDWVVSDNRITVSDSYFDAGIYGYYAGASMRIYGNTIIRQNASANQVTLFPANQCPNPLYFDSTSNYDVKIWGNKYFAKPVVNNSYKISKINWQDIYDVDGIKFMGTEILKGNSSTK